MAKEKKQLEVIDMNGVKTVAKKKSLIRGVKQTIAIITIIWFVVLFWAPLYVKNTYSQPIKKSIVVSMFFDLQQGIVKQYQALLDGVAKSVNLEKPIAKAIEGVKVVEKNVEKVSAGASSAREKTAEAAKTTTGVKKVSGLAKMFGAKTDGLDKAVAELDKGIEKTNDAINAVDNTAEQINAKLDKIKTDLTRVAQTEVDNALDSAIKTALDKQSGGLGTTLLTDYGIKHVYPWRPSSWGVATKIYDDLSKSDITTVTVITNTVDKYFGFVAWGLVVIVWALGIFLWHLVFAKVKAVIKPFNVCPRCGHTYVDKRTAMGFLKVFQPWKWF